ncbi:glycosyltransferase family 4 protein [Jiella sonneratiae]|uniref:Glycosyltransferase family 4 protein n=1 Tax=Jiella sonneratiae TaxID=2816856 RepID=A0ABS3J4F7_9HYPH|nr:glycosyltransferase family 1 protein [Jiella sonneratiae]MBO0904563.1 glycosyltransferase family 4 protein [Jiella sonneratiae]
MTLFLDLTRISSRLLRGAPTGIDRVEYAYAEALVLNQSYGPVMPVITTPLATGAIAVDTMREHLRKIEAGWLRDRINAAEDPFYMSLKAAIEAPADPLQTGGKRLKRQSRREAVAKTLHFPFRRIAAAPSLLRHTLRETSSSARRYFHASHTQLDKPDRFRWLGESHIRSAFLIHDAIPVDYPEFCSPGSADRHHRRLKTVAEKGELIVVNSAATETAVAGYMRSQGWRVPRTEVVHLGVDRWFSLERTEDAPVPEAPYFVCVGTIEPRKNLIFLLNVWRGVVERLGASAPKLVLVGRRGWENENIIDVLERSREIGPHLVEVADLSDLGLSALLKGARALLAPSLVEGFSLPVAEALAIGTPVIASDIAVHREIADDRAMLLGPVDGRGWLEAILDIGMARSDLRTEWAGRASGYRPMGWDDHVERTMAALETLSR